MKQPFFTIYIACLFLSSCIWGTKSEEARAQNFYNESVQYQGVGDYASAEEKITEAINLKSEPIYIRKKIAILFAQNKHKQAYEDLVNLKNTPIGLEAHDVSNLIVASYVLNKNDESIAYCEQKIKKNKNDFYALYYRAINNQALLNLHEAVEDLSYILAHSPDNYYGAFFERGNIYATLGLRKEAIDDYLKYLDYDSENSLVYSNIGLVFFNMGRTDDALKYFKESLKRKDSEAALQNMALYYEDRGDYSRAIDYYSLAIAQNDASVYSYIGRGELFLKLAKKQEAKASFAKAELLATSLLEKNDKNATIYLIRANAYKYLGDDEKSTIDYQKADSIYTNLIAEFPRAPRLYRLRGELFMQRGEYQKAYDDFDQSLSLDTLFLYTKKLRERAKANLLEMKL